jgi:uncharacterized protein (TIGR03083 family)
MTVVGGPWLAVEMLANIDYLAHLRAESARFAEVLRDARPDAHVPSCPEWNADDLLWHLGEVQWFWGTIVREAVRDPESLEEPHRPTDRAGLLDFFDSSSTALQKTLAETDPAETRWTWSKEQTAGFTRRRQTHEALIHRVDAELTADAERTAMDSELCGDGVDEALRIMFAAVPEWGQIEPEPASTLRIEASDTGQSWMVTLGRFTGTDPAGTAHDDPDIVIADTDSGEEVAATVTGGAADLDCWLWGRPTTGSLERFGDEHVHARFQKIVDQGLN